MSKSFTLKVTGTSNKCPIGETTGKQNVAEDKIPVFSCEGACIRGEIARVAANLIAREQPYRRGCHGEIFTVPDSAISQWAKKSKKIVLIDGCFLKCHRRILENIVPEENILYFDAFSHYHKYADKFDIDSVPEIERKEVAQSVANWVLDQLKNN